MSQTVYITNSGSKYHNSSCSYLKKSAIPMDLKEIGSSYSPCSRCNPPTIKDTSVKSTTEKTPETTTVKKQSSTTSSQCNGRTKKGARCKRMVKGGGNCWQH